MHILTKAKALTVLAMIGSPLLGETFEQICRSPSYTIIHLRGVGGNSAKLTAVATDKDIANSCASGYLTQGTMSTEECILFYADWPLESLTIHVEANCSVPDHVIYNGGRLNLSDQYCAGGGFAAAEALRILCP